MQQVSRPLGNGSVCPSGSVQLQGSNDGSFQAATLVFSVSNRIQNTVQFGALMWRRQYPGGDIPSSYCWHAAQRSCWRQPAAAACPGLHSPAPQSAHSASPAPAAIQTSGHDKNRNMAEAFMTRSARLENVACSFLGTMCMSLPPGYLGCCMPGSSRPNRDLHPGAPVSGLITSDQVCPTGQGSLQLFPGTSCISSNLVQYVHAKSRPGWHCTVMHLCEALVVHHQVCPAGQGSLRLFPSTSRICSNLVQHVHAKQAWVALHSGAPV